jgi:predicted nucleotidyltransferase
MAVTPAETLATLRHRALERRARDVERAESVRQRVLEIVRPRLPVGGRAWLIGTLAWGDFGARSDVDLVFDGTPDATMTDIELELARVSRVEVDVLRLADLPEDFSARVLREGLVLHGD